MIDKAVSRFINVRLKTLNIDKLKELMKSTGFDFHSKKLVPVAMGVPNTIYLDLRKLRGYIPEIGYFVILHEICHAKSIARSTVDKIVELFMETDFETFHKGVIEEEIRADRYASFIFHLFNKKSFEKKYTQQLHLKAHADYYKQATLQMFGRVKNKEDYFNFFKGKILN